MLVQVGLIGRPHGVKGEVTVQISTDDPADRFAAGSELLTDPAGRGPLTVAVFRKSGPVLVVGFEGVPDRNAAETLRGTTLLIDSDELPPPMDDDEFYDHQLIGLSARLADGTVLGEVVDVLHPPAAPVLQVRREDAPEDELVPFVSAIVPTVDLPGGFLVIDPPDGMFAS